jgi:spore germination cell wall hydrolase CwlJ-like protein
MLLLCSAALVSWATLAPRSFPSPLRTFANGEGRSLELALQPETTLPEVPPVRYFDLAPETARQLNAAVPFSTRPNPTAQPLILALPAADAERAIDCLAAAEWYEAGDDQVGAAAVAQVVLNRTRHPSFPATVCGVVFQGAARKTGCQFSFTCDGSLDRRPSEGAWVRARRTAAASLSGYVFKPVGWSTHYHTDWVVPYWSASVEKTAAVGTHLFFRWRGKSSDPSAFRQLHPGSEPIEPAMSRLSLVHHEGISEAAGMADLIVSQTPTIPPSATDQAASTALPQFAFDPATHGFRLSGYEAKSNSYAIQVARDTVAGRLALMALELCRQRPDAPCSVYGSSSSTIVLNASGRPTKSSDAEFYYYRDKSRGRERVLWNCIVWKRPEVSQCLSLDFRPD